MPGLKKSNPKTKREALEGSHNLPQGELPDDQKEALEGTLCVERIMIWAQKVFVGSTEGNDPDVCDEQVKRP